MTIKSKITAFLQASKNPLTNAAIAKALNLNPDSTRKALRKMRETGEVECTGVSYTLKKEPPKSKSPKQQYKTPWGLGRKTSHLEYINWIK